MSVGDDHSGENNSNSRADKRTQQVKGTVTKPEDWVQSSYLHTFSQHTMNKYKKIKKQKQTYTRKKAKEIVCVNYGF